MAIGKTKNKKERKKINDDMTLMWLNWSVATINIMFQVLDRYLLLLFVYFITICSFKKIYIYTQRI